MIAVGDASGADAAASVVHTALLDAARDLLGHRDPPITARHCIAETAPATGMGVLPRC
ncbi:MAG TPA: hypothetical protein VFJ14_07350 [Nocardioidaceae bacterium]|nr:hypothetical protein [Nocardioidaceae bacterium]